MQKKYVVLIGLNIMVHLILNWGFLQGEAVETIKPYATAVTNSKADVKLPAKHKQANMTYAILVMPKSYRPLLERFKHRKIAREIQIFPANIGWDEGRMIALSKKSFFKGTSHSLQRSVNNSRERPVMEEKSLSRQTKVARGAAVLLLLKGVAKRKFSYETKPAGISDAAF